MIRTTTMVRLTVMVLMMNGCDGDYDDGDDDDGDNDKDDDEEDDDDDEWL